LRKQAKNLRRQAKDTGKPPFKRGRLTPFTTELRGGNAKEHGEERKQRTGKMKRGKWSGERAEKPSRRGARGAEAAEKEGERARVICRRSGMIVD
jgi:hypothetical protein